MEHFIVTIKKPLIFALKIYLIFLLFLYIFQSYLVFIPFKDMQSTPDKIGLEYEPINFKSSDGTHLFGWFIPAKKPKATLLFLHGNAGNISHRLDSIKIFNLLELNVFIFDYRGYGKSEGTVNEQNTYDDAKSAWEYLLNKKGFRPEEIILFGRSLGASIAANLASSHTPKAIILESTFTSAKDIATDLYSFLVPGFLVRYNYETLNYIKNITSPVLIIHSKDDEIIPFKHGKALFDYANEPKYFLELKGSHNSGFLQSRDTYMKGLSRFILVSGQGNQRL